MKHTLVVIFLHALIVNKNPHLWMDTHSVLPETRYFLQGQEKRGLYPQEYIS